MTTGRSDGICRNVEIDEQTDYDDMTQLEMVAINRNSLSTSFYCMLPSKLLIFTVIINDRKYLTISGESSMVFDGTSIIVGKQGEDLDTPRDTDPCRYTSFRNFCL